MPRASLLSGRNAFMGSSRSDLFRGGKCSHVCFLAHRDGRSPIGLRPAFGNSLARGVTADVMAALRSRSWMAQRFQRCDQRIGSAASAAEVPRETKNQVISRGWRRIQSPHGQEYPGAADECLIRQIEGGQGRNKIGGRMTYGQTRSSGF